MNDPNFNQSGNLMLDTATQYINANLCTLPATKAGKCPTISWKKYQNQLMSNEDFESNFSATSNDALAIVCGNISGNLEVLDFDNKGEMILPFRDLLDAKDPELTKRLVIETTQSGGYHIYFRCEQKVEGNLKLASRQITYNTNEKVTICGKEYVPAKNNIGGFTVNLTLIETRGEGGLIICAPTDGYELIQGSLLEIPNITFKERNLLLNIAKSLDEIPQEEVYKKNINPKESKVYDLLPGEDYNIKGDPRPLLIEIGWKCEKQGAVEHWCRPGKESGTSASIKNNNFYVFTSNAFPFEPASSYSPFSVYAILKCEGDYKKASRELYDKGYGKRKEILPIEAYFSSNNSKDTTLNQIPEHLLNVPGFIGELTNYMYESANYPNKVLAFIGALSMQSFLCGQLVKSETGLRPNLYLLGLASSGSGKDHPRKVNTDILEKINKLPCLGDSFASAEGLEDRLSKNSCLLYQTDEIDNLLLSIKNTSKEPRFAQLMAILLKVYTSSDSNLPRRALANADYKDPIRQPFLTIFGTAIPKNYYEALSEKMLTNGLFARMLVFEAYPRSLKNHEPKLGLPDSVLNIAKYWCNQKIHNGDLVMLNFQPREIKSTLEAKELIKDFSDKSDDEYKKCEKVSDEVGMTVWGRAGENMIKLAMLYAVSKNHLSFLIEADAVNWASELVQYLVKKMLSMADKYSTDSKSEKELIKLLELVPNDSKGIPRWKLLKKSKLHKNLFDPIIETLIERGDLLQVGIESATNKGIAFKLPEFK